MRKHATTLEMLDLNEMVREVVASMDGELNSKRIKLRLELADDLPKVRGDRMQLQQVALNLTLNAVEVMASLPVRKAELVIETFRSEGGILVRVCDTGGGVEVEDLEQIFTPFVTTKPQGAGVGLSISRSILQSQQGRLWATRNPAAGTTFRCWLPLPNGLRESIGNVATRQDVHCDGNGAG
jgi:signal transduction histidine kinase